MQPDEHKWRIISPLEWVVADQPNRTNQDFIAIRVKASRCRQCRDVLLDERKEEKRDRVVCQATPAEMWISVHEDASCFVIVAGNSKHTFSSLVKLATETTSKVFPRMEKGKALTHCWSYV